MSIQRANEKDISCIAPLIAQFRVELKRFNGICSNEQLEAAKQELPTALFIFGKTQVFAWAI